MDSSFSQNSFVCPLSLFWRRPCQVWLALSPLSVHLVLCLGLCSPGLHPLTLAERHGQILLLSLTFLLSSSDPPWADLHPLHPLPLSSCPMVRFVTWSVCHFLGGLSTPLSFYFCVPHHTSGHPEWMHLCIDLLPSCGHSPCPCLCAPRSLSLLSLLGFPP